MPDAAPDPAATARARLRLGPLARAWAEDLIAAGHELDLARLGARPFGDSVELADDLAALVTGGTKTATTSLVWMLEHTGRPIPTPGDLTILTRFDGTPVCLFETTAATVVRFADVTADFAAAEGEDDGTLAAYVEGHTAYFGRECAVLGRTPSPDMRVVCERFRVLRVR